MGAACSSFNQQQRKQTKQINKEIKHDKNERSTRATFLLLGAGDVGKSTILKQMRIIHQQNYTFEELNKIKTAIYINIVSSLTRLIEDMEHLHITYENPENEKWAKRFIVLRSFVNTGDMDPNLAQCIKSLWADRGIQACFESCSPLNTTSVPYFFDAIDRLTQPSYLPTNRDVVQARIKTRKINEVRFKLQKTQIILLDVGGQRNERRKWIHCFENVTALFFCASLVDYDQVLEEDERTNRMKESIQLFRKIGKSRYFIDTPIVLFLNKCDLLKGKIAKSPLSICFPDYTGADSYEEACLFIENIFLQQNDNMERKIYPHFTCATNTLNIKCAFDIVFEVVVQMTRLNPLGLGI